MWVVLSLARCAVGVATRDVEGPPQPSQCRQLQADVEATAARRSGSGNGKALSPLELLERRRDKALTIQATEVEALALVPPRAGAQVLQESSSVDASTTTTTTTTTTATTASDVKQTTTTTSEGPTTTSTTTSTTTTSTTTPEPITTLTTTTSTSTTSTSTSTTTTTTEEPTTTSTTSTQEPTTPTSTTTTTSLSFNTASSSSKGRWWIALAVVLPVAALIVVAAVVWCCCAGKLCFAARAATGCATTATTVLHSPAKSGGSWAQRSVGGPRCTNPLSLSSPKSSVRAVPLVAGDPEHINWYSNQPFQVNGVVPWTGRPPVLRGPQPTCVVPTIERDGTVIPREERVSPGLGLFETPKIYIDVPMPLPSADTQGASGNGQASLHEKVRRRSKMSGVAAPQERLQWFHQLIHFTPLEHSPAITESDESDAEKEDDESAFSIDVHTDAAPQTAAVTPVVAVPVEVRKYGEVGTTRRMQSSSSRAPRPQAMSGPVLHRTLPPTVLTHSCPSSGDAAFALNSGAIPVAGSPQYQLSAQALSSSSTAEAKVPSPLSDPAYYTYSWRATGSINNADYPVPPQ
ncbi:hypothetical protein N2W54_002157 [Lotmaria passim]